MNEQNRVLSVGHTIVHVAFALAQAACIIVFSISLQLLPGVAGVGMLFLLVTCSAMSDTNPFGDVVLNLTALFVAAWAFHVHRYAEKIRRPGRERGRMDAEFSGST